MTLFSPSVVALRSSGQHGYSTRHSESCNQGRNMSPPIMTGVELIDCANEIKFFAHSFVLRATCPHLTLLPQIAKTIPLR